VRVYPDIPRAADALAAGRRLPAPAMRLPHISTTRSQPWWARPVPPCPISAVP